MSLIASVQLLVYFALDLVVFGLAVWALVDAIARPAGAFVSAGKRTKGFWLAVTGAATAIMFTVVPPLGSGSLSLLALLSAVAAIVYLVDVRPAVRPYSGPRRRGPGGPKPPSRGGW